MLGPIKQFRVYCALLVVAIVIQGVVEFNMADPPIRLRSTDFLPSRFQGDMIDSDLARAH